MEKVVVTGGAGYIGSHVCKALKASGFYPIVFDHFKQGHRWAIKWGPFFEGDLNDKRAISQCLKEHQPIGVIHLASLINVRESILNPGKYYFNNVLGTLNLLEAMIEHSIYSLVFSSSAAVYGAPQTSLISENTALTPLNPYGKSKHMGEELIKDFATLGLNTIMLRYFNASGADPDGEIGEAHDPETHLIPSLIKTLLGERSVFSIYGTDHPTPDGTAIRDFVHVSDLAKAHVQSLERVFNIPETLSLNLGTGVGHSLKEIITQLELLTQKTIPLKVEPRNPLEPSVLVADSSLAKKTLKWNPTLSSLETILTTALNWHSHTYSNVL